MGGIAGRRQRGKGVLLADGHLNVEISPALAKRKRRLRDPDIVGDLVARADGVVAERLRHLEKASNDVIAVLLIGGNKAVFGQENRIIAPSVRLNALRRGGLHVRREAENDLGIVCGDDLEAFAAAPIEDVVVVAPSAAAVLLVEEVEAKFLLEARRHCCERRYPVGLGRLTGRNHVKPVQNPVPCRRRDQRRRTADAGEIGQIRGVRGQRCDCDRKGECTRAYKYTTHPNFNAGTSQNSSAATVVRWHQSPRKLNPRKSNPHSRHIRAYIMAILWLNSSVSTGILRELPADDETVPNECSRRCRGKRKNPKQVIVFGPADDSERAGRQTSVIRTSETGAGL